MINEKQKQRLLSKIEKKKIGEFYVDENDGEWQILNTEVESSFEDSFPFYIIKDREEGEALALKLNRKYKLGQFKENKLREEDGATTSGDIAVVPKRLGKVQKRKTDILDKIKDITG